MSRDALDFWTLAGRLLHPQVMEAARSWADAHLEAPGVASAEGIMIAVRRRHNRFAREKWNNLLAADPRMRAACVCPEIVLGELAGQAGPADQAAAVAAEVGVQVERAQTRAKAAMAVRATTLAGKIASFAAAVTGPSASDAESARRLAICESNVCGHLVTRRGELYCGACGCPKWKLAELKTKTRFANLECPCDPPLWAAIESEGA